MVRRLYPPYHRTRVLALSGGPTHRCRVVRLFPSVAFPLHSLDGGPGSYGVSLCYAVLLCSTASRSDIWVIKNLSRIGVSVCWTSITPEMARAPWSRDACRAAFEFFGCRGRRGEFFSECPQRAITNERNAPPTYAPGLIIGWVKCNPRVIVY